MPGYQKTHGAFTFRKKEGNKTNCVVVVFFILLEGRMSIPISIMTNLRLVIDLPVVFMTVFTVTISR